MNFAAGRKFQSIQLLRAIAALMVVVFHSKSVFEPEIRTNLWWWPGISDQGALGVSLFFVISGFIIAMTLDKKDVDFGVFAWRRFLRIYPLYWIVMLAALGTYLWDRWFHVDLEAIGLSGMIVSFLILPQKPFPFWSPGWSLEHELLFYLIAGLVAPKLGLCTLCAVMMVLGGVGFWVSFWDFHLFSDAQIYFGAGVGAYLYRNAGFRLAAIMATALLAIAYAHLYGFLDFPYQFRSLAFAFGYAALIVAFVGLERRGWKVPNAGVLIGSASYSLYLWHWLMIPVIGRVFWSVGGPVELWRWIFVFASIVVALLSYALIEKPISSLAHRQWRQPNPATG
ncbi:MAG TPA: acyltransferase [Mesorhizobium sp.]|jgi:peptidoglycan/LPS O-acetylase OafA/YrhL|uniref:acyltransferase family protein n=1 Tax=Mesorhizobium sp. TaxID=1871066 RepID=UPI002DDCC9E3|nr:acyltransferase [Mesorhizobium sp.]HEV2504451.1 acyltransferase [Mesorhizobium sp.]